MSNLCQKVKNVKKFMKKNKIRCKMDRIEKLKYVSTEQMFEGILVEVRDASVNGYFKRYFRKPSFN